MSTLGQQWLGNFCRKALVNNLKAGDIMMQFNRFLVGALLCLSVAGCGGPLTTLAENMLYPFADVNKKFKVSDTPPAGYSQVYFDVVASDGSPMKVHTWFHKAADPDARVLVYFHGNGENLEAVRSSNLLEALAAWGFTVVTFDYPGLGRSKGFPDEANLVNSGLAVVDWARASFNGRMVIWGRSLGAAVAAQVASKTRAVYSGLMLTSPWASFLELAKDKTGLAGNLPKEWIERHTYNTVKAVATINVETLIHHGNKDTLIPIKFGRKVYASFPAGVATFNEIDALGHNDIFKSQKLFSDLKAFQLTH